MIEIKPKTVEAQMAVILEEHADRRKSSWMPSGLYDFEIPQDLLKAAAEYTCSDDNPPVTPPEIRELSASYGLVVMLIDRGYISFGKQLKLSDPVAMLTNDLETIGIHDVGIDVIGQLVEFLREGHRLLRLVGDGYIELKMLYCDLRAQGFID